MKRLSFLLFSLLFILSCHKEQQKKQNKVENVLYDKAFVYRDSGKGDSAFLYFNKAKDFFLKQNDSLGVAKCLANMAQIATNNGDYFNGQDLSLNALKYFDTKKNDQYVYLISNYNNLGIATAKIQDYVNALKFYDLAIKFTTNHEHIRVGLNNKAKVYARTLTNIALTKWLQNPKYNAAPIFLKALNIRKRENDLEGLNSSYAHLADYYSYTNNDSTLIYASEMYKVAKKLNSPDDQVQALQTLIRFGPPQKVKQYFEVYQSLRDSLQNVRSASRNQFAIIRYDVEKKETENILLQKDNINKKYQIIKREVMLYGTLLVVFVVSIFAIFWYKKRKQRLELETKNTIRNSQLKTSKKVHDVVANGLYRVMAEIENQHEIDKEGILDRLENMYEKSRDISYEVEQLQPPGQNFDEKITALLNSFATENTKVTINGNSAILWAQITPQVKTELEHILQELMVNMKKHSKAKQVTLDFVQQAEQLHIYYADDGLGLPADVKFKNGLTNTGNRMASIDGTITFDTNVEQGLKIQLSFPVS